MPVIAGFIMPHPLLIVLEVGKVREKEINKTIDSFVAAAREMATLNPETVVIISPKSCHVEVTLLIIPGENDSVTEMNLMAAWLAEVSQDIPLHISRFFALQDARLISHSA